MIDVETDGETVGDNRSTLTCSASASHSVYARNESTTARESSASPVVSRGVQRP